RPAPIRTRSSPRSRIERDLVPLYGAIMSSALLGESLHIYHAIGMATIIAGLARSNMLDRLPEQATLTRPTRRSIRVAFAAMRESTVLLVASWNQGVTDGP